MMHALEQYESSTSVSTDESGECRQVGSRAARRDSTYWVLVEPESPLTVFTLEVRNEASALPVFSSHEEALSFVSEVPGCKGALAIRETGGGELISLLSAPLRGVRHVALDPPGGYLPEALELVCVGRGVFLDRLLGRGRSWMEGTLGAAYPAALAHPVPM